MRIAFWTFCLIALIFMNPFKSAAFMNTQISLIGFSESGDHLAYEVYGFDTGTETGFSLVQIVDVVRNDFAVDDILEKDQKNLLTLSKINLKKAAPLLKKYGIVHANKGELVFEDVRYNDHLTRYKAGNAVKQAAFNILRDAATVGYTVRVRTFEYHSKTCEHLKKVNIPPKIFELTLIHKNQLTILQKDKVLYQSRQCPFDYGIYRIYVYRDRLAVFLHSWTAGHQGPNVQKLIVTGTLIRAESF